MGLTLVHSYELEFPNISFSYMYALIEGMQLINEFILGGVTVDIITYKSISNPKCLCMMSEAHHGPLGPLTLKKLSVCSY